MVDQVFGAGQLRFANLTPAELAQQARQRDGVQQSQRFREIPQSQPPEPGRVQQARPIPPDQGNVPAVRPADLAQQSQLTLAAANASGERPQGADISAPSERSGARDDIGGRGPSANPVEGDRPAEPSVPAVDVSDPDPADAGNAVASGPDGQPGADAERRIQFRALTERVNALQDAAAEAGRTDVADGQGAPANDDPTASPDISQTGTTNGAAGPVLPSGSNLNLVA